MTGTITNDTATTPARNRLRLRPWGRIGEDIQAIFDRDPAARSVPDVLTGYPGLHAILLHRVAHRLWVANHRFAARLLSHLGRAFTGIEIHPAAKIGRRFVIDHGMGVVIGETADIGDDVLVYQGVTLGATSRRRGKRHPTLEDGALVGAGATILGAVTIGRSARIGAGAVVVGDVPPGSTVLGTVGHVVTESPTGQHILRTVPFHAESFSRGAGI